MILVNVNPFLSGDNKVEADCPPIILDFYGTAFTWIQEKHLMIALEFKEPVEVTTPKGDGYIWYMIDYGPHSDTLYTIVIKETGECWQMSHKDFRVKSNVSLGVRDSYQNGN